MKMRATDVIPLSHVILWNATITFAGKNVSFQSQHISTSASEQYYDFCEKWKHALGQ